MLTRRDLIHSRQFLHQRMTAALVMHKADPLDWSGRRMATATFFAVMLTVISFAVVGIYALIVPGGNTRWQACNAPIVEKETGAVFVCSLERGRVLFPMANYASARLFHPEHHDRFLVNSASLDWPRVGRLGISGAPQAIPSGKQLTAQAWAMCSRLSHELVPAAQLFAGLAPPPAGRRLGAEAILVTDPSGANHLVWRGRRHHVRDEIALKALRAFQGVPVGLAWLNSLEQGPDLAKLDIAEAGAPTWRQDIVVGQIVMVSNPDGSQKPYVAATKDALHPITELQMALIIAGYPAINAAAPLVVPSTLLIGRERPALDPRGLPDAAPPQVVALAPESGVCVVVTRVGEAPVLLADVRLERLTARPAASPPVADYVFVPASSGVLVESAPSPAAVGALILVTDSGMGYRITSAEAAKRLGYEGVAPLRLPSLLAARVPLGPDLDHTLAGSVLSPVP